MKIFFIFSSFFGNTVVFLPGPGLRTVIIRAFWIMAVKSNAGAVVKINKISLTYNVHYANINGRLRKLIIKTRRKWYNEKMVGNPVGNGNGPQHDRLLKQQLI